MALFAQKAEHEYAGDAGGDHGSDDRRSGRPGTRCCWTAATIQTFVPIDSEDLRVVDRQHDGQARADSGEYAKRRTAMRAGGARISRSRIATIKALRDVTMGQSKRRRASSPDVVFRRVPARGRRDHPHDQAATLLTQAAVRRGGRADGAEPRVAAGRLRSELVRVRFPGRER